jgi:Arc/MetJ-type ribon-helix-helix transcriptional regulator
MKANKALKRLAKIDAWISDVTERYSSRASHIREALRDAKAAIARVKEAISSQAPSERAKRAPVKRKKAAVKKAAVKTPTVNTGKKSTPIKKAAKKAAAKKTVPAPAQTATTPAAEISMGK